MHSALASTVQHDPRLVLGIALIAVGGALISQTKFGIAMAIVGLLIIPWHYLLVGAAVGAAFAAMAVVFGK